MKRRARQGKIPAASARAVIFERIRQAQAGLVRATDPAAEWQCIPRNYRQGTEASRQEVLELFEERLRDYDAEVVRCPPQDAAAAIASRLTARGKRTVLLPPGIAAEYLPAGFDFVVDRGLGPAELDRFDTVLTAAALGIAETGTFVLQAGPGQGRRAISLVPDYHLCVVRAEQVVATVPEAVARLGGNSALATTFVSGPSATADIEMTRIKGVHGPRVLDIVLLV